MLENNGQFETFKNELFTNAYNVETLCDMSDIVSKSLFEADSLEVVIQWFSS